MKFSKKFRLSEEFINSYKNQEVDWGFDGLGEVVYYRTYSRRKEDGSKEQWYETVKRVTEGAMSMYVGSLDDALVRELAEGMYHYMFNFKFLPGGRGLWSMGTNIVHEKGLVEALSNCAFVSTYNEEDPARPFAFQMDISMLGVGLGLDTKAAGRVQIHNPRKSENVFVIPDSREGWVESLYMMLNAYLTGESKVPTFDYSKIRKAGEPIKTFGGISAGPGPLKDLHKSLEEMFEGREGEFLTKKDVVDISTRIGKSVVSGNVRRSAILMLDNEGTQEFIDLKNYEKNPDRVGHGWVANHSFNMDTENKIDFESVVGNINKNGEPGLLWMDKIRKYGRLVDGPLEKPDKAEGVNACGEMALESYEHCLLSEVFLNRVNNFHEFKQAGVYAYLYGKAVTMYLANSRWKESSEVITRNRRMGISLGGVAQFLFKKDEGTLIDWSDMLYGYLRNFDEIISGSVGIAKSIKITTIKPSGTVSYLSGSTPGAHFPMGEFVEKRMRVSKELTSLVDSLKKSGLKYEEAVNEPNTLVFYFPMSYADSLRNPSMKDQIRVAEILTKYFTDNQVSLTVTIPEGTTDEDLLNAVKDSELKALTFFPEFTEEVPQKPMEVITRRMFRRHGNYEINLNYKNGEDSNGTKYCKDDFCEIKDFQLNEEKKNYGNLELAFKTSS